MTTKKKALLVAACAIVLILASVIGTLAYLTSQDAVKNTFTVGDVQIILDEAKTDEYGVEEPGADRVKANEYKLIPGHNYKKDPTVTVLKDSEESFVRMLVTINEQAALDAIYGTNGIDLSTFFTGFDTTKWELVKETENNDDTRTYEFRYYEKVETVGDTEDLVLEPLFTNLVVPKYINNAQLKSIEDLEINIVAQAIQADGFNNDADAAWAGFAEQVEFNKTANLK